jgi:DNA topoisomerase-6 subunit A
MGEKQPSQGDEKGHEALHALQGIAEEIYGSFEKGDVPRVKIPLRTKSNLEFVKKSGVWKLGKDTGERSAKKLTGALMLLRTMYLVKFIEEMMDGNKTSTLREMYYISEGWKHGHFSDQGESNALVEDLEASTHLLREEFRLRPEENGASLIGNIVMAEVNRKGQTKRIHCSRDIGDAGYTIPSNVEHDRLSFKDCDADFVLAIECGGMFDRLAENGFDEDNRAILIHLKGQPARSTRRLLKRLNTECNLPVVVFTDCDPWSFRIFASVTYGAISTAYISDYLATPTAEFLGVTPSDIQNYDLPSDKLNEKDVQALNELKSDPRFDDPFWRSEIDMMLEANKKAEQQSLAKYGLEFVSSTYLPEKLSDMGMLKR